MINSQTPSSHPPPHTPTEETKAHLHHVYCFEHHPTCSEGDLGAVAQEQRGERLEFKSRVMMHAHAHPIKQVLHHNKS